MSFEEYLKEKAVRIDEIVKDVIESWARDASCIHPSLEDLTESFKTANSGGKRLRGVLCYLGFEIASPSARNDEILQPAAALEIFQTGILAQDDIIDLSPLRRGRPTIYKELGGDHYAISQTICLGDIGLFIAVKLVSESGFSDKNKTKAITAFAQMTINTVHGEMLDVELPRIKEKTDEAVLKIHKLKTSYYTIIYPLQMGFILGGGDDNKLKKIEEFGEGLGIAFQIQDDILGVFGDEKTLGKSVTSDIEEGKNTLLITYALEHTDGKQRKVLDQHYGKGKVTEEIHQQIKKVFTDTGALEYSRTKALEYVSKAKEVIPKITSNPKHGALLEGLADFLINRDK